MFETVNYSNRSQYRRVPSPRTLTWIREAHFQGPTCSQCAWLFRPSGPPIGNSLQEMRKNYIRRCTEEFAAHDCADYPRAAKTSVSVNQSSHSRNTEGRSARTKLRSGMSDS